MIFAVLKAIKAYIKSFFCSKNEKPEYLEPLDPRQKIYEDYMQKDQLRELNDIFSYVRKKENRIKEKCKLRSPFTDD